MDNTNQQEENSFLIIKPDGIALGLTEAIRQLIEQRKLIIEIEYRLKLTSSEVAELYADFKERDYFPLITSTISSGPIHVFFLHGINAISQIREIIGKRDGISGLRAIFAKSIVENVAHGPHNHEEVIIQSTILKQAIERRINN